MNKLTIYSMEEVSKLNTANSCWVVAHGNVYDATGYINRHPGKYIGFKRRYRCFSSLRLS